MKPSKRDTLDWLPVAMTITFFVTGMIFPSHRFAYFVMSALFAASIYSSMYHKLREYMSYVEDLEKERDEYQHKYYDIADKYLTLQRKKD